MKRLVLRYFRATAGYLCRALLILACITVVDLSACHGPTDTKDVSVHFAIAPLPVREGPSTVTIQLTNSTGMAIPHARINVEGDMSHPGMAPVFAEASELAPGDYQAHLDFNMPGDWVVLLHIRLANGKKIERQMDVRGVESN